MPECLKRCESSFFLRGKWEGCVLARRKRLGEACAFSDPALILLRAGFTSADMLDGAAKKGHVISKQSVSVEAI